MKSKMVDCGTYGKFSIQTLMENRKPVQYGSGNKTSFYEIPQFLENIITKDIEFRENEIEQIRNKKIRWRNRKMRDILWGMKIIKMYQREIDDIRKIREDVIKVVNGQRRKP